MNAKLQAKDDAGNYRWYVWLKDGTRKITWAPSADVAKGKSKLAVRVAAAPPALLSTNSKGACIACT